MTIERYELIRSAVPKAALLEQLVEEMAELQQACLKAVRTMRGENPTPMSWDDVLRSINEETSDVLLLFNLLNMAADPAIIDAKTTRWCERLLGRKVTGWS